MQLTTKAFQGYPSAQAVANDDLPSTRREGELEFGPARLRYACNDDGTDWQVDSLVITPDSTHKTMDDALLEMVAKMLKSVGSSLEELIELNREESQEVEA